MTRPAASYIWALVIGNGIKTSYLLRWLSRDNIHRYFGEQQNRRGDDLTTKSEKPQMIVGFCDPLSGDGLWSAVETDQLRNQMMQAGLVNQVSLLGGGDQETASAAEFVVNSAPVALPAVMGFAGAWVQAKFGRKIRLKKGDLEIEAATIEEVELLWDKVSTAQQE